MAEKKRVVAKKTGFFGGVRRREGDTFTVPVHVNSKWFDVLNAVEEVVEAVGAVAKVSKKAKAEPVAAAGTADQEVI